MSTCPDCEKPIAGQAERNAEPSRNDHAHCWRVWNGNKCQTPKDWRSIAKRFARFHSLLDQMFPCLDDGRTSDDALLKAYGDAIVGLQAPPPVSTLLDLTTEVERLTRERDDLRQTMDVNAAGISRLIVERDGYWFALHAAQEAGRDLRARLATSDQEIARLIDTGQAEIADAERERDEAKHHLSQAMRSIRDGASDLATATRERDALSAQLKQAQAQFEDYARRAADDEQHWKSAAEQAQDEAAAMRETLEAAQPFIDPRTETIAGWSVPEMIRRALSTTAGAEVLRERDALRKALATRCPGCMEAELDERERLAALSGQGKATP